MNHPKRHFTDFDFEQNIISVDPYRYCSRFQLIQNVLPRNLRQPFSRKSPGAVVYIACILDDPSWCEHLNTVQGLTPADAPQRATPQYYGMAYSQAIRRLP
jgi:hypothetical protein